MKYINTYAKYGVQKGKNLDYQTLPQILEEMDRLGIWQTVVEYVNRHNASYQNEKLLSDIAALPEEQRGRVIPSFMLDIASLVQRGAMEKNMKIFEQVKPLCITLRPKSNSYRLRTADMALEYVKHLNPVIFIDLEQFRTEIGQDDLIALAQKYPNMRFVVRRVPRSAMTFMIEVMHRAENVYIDNSWFHAADALEIFTQFFGEHRVLFALAFKANVGASMAAITFARMSEEAKEKIRYQNFIDLFSDEESRKILQDNLREIPNRVPNRFWTAFVDQGIAPDVPVYDIHTHIGPISGTYLLRDPDFDSQIATFEEDMQIYNLRKIVTTLCGSVEDVLEDNRKIEQAVKGKEDRFQGYLRFDPNSVEGYTKEYLDELFSRDFFIGFKTHPSSMKIEIRDPRYEVMFRYAHEHQLPILIHCWDGGMDSPMKCAEAALKWPGAKVILGHSGGGDSGRRECEAIAQDSRYDHIYFEFCGSFPSAIHWEETLQKIDYRRVFYGTDACTHTIAWEMGRLLSTDIPEEQLIAILGGNAKRLFGFED